MIARQWAFFHFLHLSSPPLTYAWWYRRNNCFNLSFFFFSFPFLSRSELPAGCYCLLGVCNNPRTLSAAFNSLPYYLGNHLVAIFSDQLGAISGQKSPSHREEKLCYYVI